MFLSAVLGILATAAENVPRAALVAAAGLPGFRTSAIDNFFQNIFQGSVEHKVSNESIILVAAFFVIVGLLVAGTYIFSRKPKGVLTEQPMTWIVDYNRIHALLDAAVLQRSKVRVSFHRESGPSRSTDATLLSVSREGLNLEMSSLRTIDTKWIGHSLDCSFHLRLPENPKVFSNFSFVGEILDVKELDGEIVEVVLSPPLRLELNQYRSSLRVEPPERYVRTVQIWPENPIRNSRGGPENPDQWGDPLFSATVGATPELKLENISAGGLRLEINPEALMRNKAHAFSVNQNYFCLLTLTDIHGEGLNTYYLFCKVVKCYDDCTSKSQLSLGMIFTGRGLPQDPPLTGLKWRTVNRDWGIQDLDNWAFELHLELYRNKGL